MGWLGVTNGRLLQLVAGSGQFDAFVTVDRNLPRQQNLSGLPFAVIILRVRTTRVPDVLAPASGLLVALTKAAPGSGLTVELPD